MEFEELNSRVKEITPAIPFKGIERFYDISGILCDPNLFSATVDQLGTVVESFAPDYICALDARGFLLASPVSINLKIPLVMIRKRGKLPGDCVSISYDKEYESGDILEMQSGAIPQGSRVVIIDDILATGGTLKAARDLVRLFNPSEIVCVCLIDIGLPGATETLKNLGLRVVSLFDASQW